MAREIPEDIKKRRQQWQDLANTYYWINNILGFASTGLSAVIAANTRGQFLSPNWAVTVAVLAACFAFLLTTFSAKAKAERFEVAARELEKAMALFEYDDSMSLKELGKAMGKGIDLLNKLGTS